MSLPPGVGRPASSQGPTSPMPQAAYVATESSINPALVAAAHGHSYPPTHLPPKQKQRYQRDPGDPSPGLLAPPPAGSPFGRSPPPPSFGPAGNGRGIQPPPLVIPNSTNAVPNVSPGHSHHHSTSTGSGSASSAARSAPADSRSPFPPIIRDDPNPQYPLTESPRGLTPPPLQPPLNIPAPSMPLLPSPVALISPSPRNSYDRSGRQSNDRSSGDGGRVSDGSRGYFDALIERNTRLEERVKQLESYVTILWEERGAVLRRHPSNEDPRIAS